METAAGGCRPDPVEEERGDGLTKNSAGVGLGQGLGEGRLHGVAVEGVGRRNRLGEYDGAGEVQSNRWARTIVAASAGVSTRTTPSGSPLDRVVNAGNSLVWYPITGTP